MSTVGPINEAWHLLRLQNVLADLRLHIQHLPSDEVVCFVDVVVPLEHAVGRLVAAVADVRELRAEKARRN